MHPEPTLFDEWHLHWWIDVTRAHDAEQLRSDLNSEPVHSAIETAIREIIRRTPALKPLSLTLSR